MYFQNMSFFPAIRTDILLVKYNVDGPGPVMLKCKKSSCRNVQNNGSSALRCAGKHCSAELTIPSQKNSKNVIRNKF